MREWLPDEQLQSIAQENNLSETAFFVPDGANRYQLRWFTPKVEVDLCGHATLASAYIILTKLAPGERSVSFETKSGELVVTRDGELFFMDFPALPPAPCTPHPQLIAGLGLQPETVLAGRSYMAVYSSEDEVRRLQPNMETLARLDRPRVTVTAPGRSTDFVSRFFAPAIGIPEDPVTGGAHCSLIPYWAKRLGKSTLRALQVSARGGELWCEDRGSRVTIGGKAVRFLEGTIYL